MSQRVPVVAMVLISLSPACVAQPLVEALTVIRNQAEVMQACTADRLCAEVSPWAPGCEGQACETDLPHHEGWTLRLSGSQNDPAHTTYGLEGLASGDDDPSFSLWPSLIRFEGGVLAGVETHARAMYSGGGANSTTLHLIAFLPGQLPFEVLSVAYSANVMIRACFSERDLKHRAGACHDLYSFDATIIPEEAVAGGMPLLHYRSEATSFPGPVSRSRDSRDGKPLRKGDLVEATDPQCSYYRLYRFDPEARGYLPDAPLPDCSDYTEP